MPISPKSLLYLPRLVLSSTPGLYVALFSLSHTLISRVASLRQDRGDEDGAARLQALASILGSCGLRLYSYAWNIWLDFAKNYQWKEVACDLGRVLFDLNELFAALGDLRRVRSDTEIMAWAGGISNSIFTRLLNVFHRSGPLRDIVLSLQKEVVDGDLLRDCIELGSNDLKNLMEIIKGIVPVSVPTAAP